MLEHDRRYFNLSPKGEPQLGRRGLDQPLGGAQDARGLEHDLLWVLNLSDGSHSLLDIARRSGLPFARIKEAQCLLTEHGLLALRGQPRERQGADLGL